MTVSSATQPAASVHLEPAKQQPSAPAPAPVSQTPPDASEIVDYFVYNYYNMMTKEPDKLHLFYGETSTMTLGFEGEKVTREGRGQQDIADMIRSLGLKSSFIAITSLDFQASIEESILVFIVGEMVKADSGGAMARFAQTFVLAPQTQGYFVLNDCFRFLTKPAPNAAAPFSLASCPELQPPERALEPGPSAAQAPEAPAAAASGSEARESSSWARLAAAQTDRWVSTEVSKPATAMTVAPLQEPPQPAAAKKPVALSPASAPAKSQPSKTLAAAMLSTRPLPPALDMSAASSRFSLGQGNADPELSVFIKGIRRPISAEILRSHLEAFGLVSYIDIVPEKTCAFVNYKTPAGAQAAMNQVMRVDGMDLIIEARKFKNGFKETHHRASRRRSPKEQ